MKYGTENAMYIGSRGTLEAVGKIPFHLNIKIVTTSGPGFGTRPE
jgi:hypothetical protein